VPERTRTPLASAKAGALVLIAIAVLTAGCGHSPRRTAAEVLGSTMLADLPHVVRIHVVRKHHRSGAHPSKNYRRAVVFHDRRGECPADDPRSVRCGAKLELHKNRARAIRRMARLRARNADHRREYDYRQGALVLRVSAAVGKDGAKAYHDAFETAFAAGGHLVPGRA
jgi:hypothetical protein